MILYQPESGYCYNSDSIFLYDFIDNLNPRGDILDIGAGCGVVGLLCARDNKKLKLEAVETQEEFIIYAKNNARVNKIEYNLHEGDFLDISFEKKYDYIVSNPPFYHNGANKSTNKMLRIARYSENLPLDKFFKKVSQILKPHSHFVFCYDATSFGDICVELAKVKMKIVDVQFVHPKLDRKASLVMIHARNGSSSAMRVLEPFVSFDGEEVSSKAKAIFKKAKTQSIKCQI